MARKFRNKAQLLATYAAYKAVQKDNKDLRYKTVYWRMGVTWCVTLWKEEGFSANGLVEFMKYINEHDVNNLGEERRQEIRKMLGKKVDWTLKNQTGKARTNNEMDVIVNKLMYYNTEISVDYSLLACEFLMKHKGYSTKRLNRVIGDILWLDHTDTQTIITMRQQLFDAKGVWIALDQEQPGDVENFEVSVM